MEQVLPGQIVNLPVVAMDELGAWLKAGHREVLLPARFVPHETEEGTELEVCLFHNEEGDLEVTRRLPHTPLGSVAFLTVRNVHNGAAYVNIGLPRDVLIPEREQVYALEPKDRSVVYIGYDSETGTLFGTTRLLHHLKTKNLPYEKGQEVEALVFDRADFGWRVVVNGRHCAIMFEKEIFHEVKRGKVFKAWVRDTEDGNLVVSLQRDGMEGLEDACRKIMAFLENHKGYMRMNDNTDPEEIKLRLRMSKKTFKRACGHLMRDGKVVITKRGVKLAKPQSPAPEA